MRNSWDYPSTTDWPQWRRTERNPSTLGQRTGGWRTGGWRTGGWRTGGRQHRRIRYWLSVIGDWWFAAIISVSAVVLGLVPLEATSLLGYRVDRIEIKGYEQLDQSMLIQSNIGVQKGEPIFALDLQVIAERLLAQNHWLKAVTVKRNLPDGLEIIVQERQPMALWWHLVLGSSSGYGELSVIDQDGKRIEGATIELRLTEAERELSEAEQELLEAEQEFLERFAQLLIVAGPNAPERTSELLAELEQVQGLEERVIIAEWIDNRRWNLHLRENIVVKLPESEISGKLRLLKALLNQEYHLPEGEVIDLQLADVIDLRLENKVVIGYRTP